MTYILRPSSILKTIFISILALLLANILSIIFNLNTQNIIFLGIATIFDFNQESNIPSLFSTLILLTCSILIFYIYKIKRPDKTSSLSWLALSILFLFLSIDEMSSIHEKIMFLIKGSFNMSGVFFYAWIIPYGIFIILFALVYIPFLICLPKKIRMMFLVSGTIYVLGAVGIEILGGIQDEANGQRNLLYSFLYTVEELLEMIGISFFIYTLLCYIREYTHLKEIKIKINS